MNSNRFISILSLLLLALSVFGKSNPSNLRRAVSTDVETNNAFEIEVDDEKRLLVSTSMKIIINRISTSIYTLINIIFI
jgi:hypothetical protein